MQNENKVSIIIPSYNTAHYVCEAIDSVLKSTYKNYEIIIVDDESTDNTKEVVEPYLQNYNTIKYIFQKNKGLAGTRNTGIEAAKGEYLIFLDSDDIILPEKLEKQIKFLNENKDYDIVYSRSLNFIEVNHDEIIDLNLPNWQGNILQNLWFGNFIHVNSAMVRKKAVDKVNAFNSNYRELEDWDLWLRMSIEGSKFGYISETLSKVRVRKTSMTVNQSKMDLAMVKVLENILPYLIQHPTVYKAHKKNYFHALGLFKIKTRSKSFTITIQKALSEIGLSFLPIWIKLILKRMIYRGIKNQNKTTKQLEKIWNE